MSDKSKGTEGQTRMKRNEKKRKEKKKEPLLVIPVRVIMCCSTTTSDAYVRLMSYFTFYPP